MHLVRWVWHREERRVRYDEAVARSKRRELNDKLLCIHHFRHPYFPRCRSRAKSDDESGGDWPVREAVDSLYCEFDHDAAEHDGFRAS